MIICGKLKITLTVAAQKVEDETSTAQQLEEVYFMKNSSSFPLKKAIPLLIILLIFLHAYNENTYTEKGLVLSEYLRNTNIFRKDNILSKMLMQHFNIFLKSQLPLAEHSW